MSDGAVREGLPREHDRGSRTGRGTRGSAGGGPATSAAVTSAATTSAAAAPGGATATAAAGLPVARVGLDVGLPHLDRPFDYLVAAEQSAAAVPGARVRVRFAGRVVDGFVLERAADTEHGGRLAPLRRVVSPEPVLTPEVARLARLVADRYAGTAADVRRLAVPPRHARVEAAASPPAAPPPPPPAPAGWAAYAAGPALLRSLAARGSPRAVCSALPGPGWPDLLARAVVATLAGGRGALVVLPDARDVGRVDAALTALAPGQHVALTADLGPAERYRRWLRALRGGARAVVGTRAAAFAPVRDLGLVVVWDDGDDSHAEPRAPYPHAREVLCLRAHDAGAGALVAGLARTAEAALLVETGWARELTAERAAVRAAAPRVRVPDPTDADRDPAAAAARLPTAAWAAARQGLQAGPVLVQVPRAGYLAGASCQGCRRPARCVACAGPLGVPAAGARPACRWCGTTAAGWRCRTCEGAALRATAVGARRTAEELGRAFPGVPVRTSGRDVPTGVLDTVPGSPALVVATPGAEPVAADGYAAALLLDGWALLSRPDLRAGEEALRRWLAAAALVRPADDGGVVVVTTDGGLGPVQALVRWDPASAAARELADRRALGFPPAARVAGLTGAEPAVHELLTLTRLPPQAQVLGPVPVDDGGRADPAGAAGPRYRALVRVPRAHGLALARELRAAQGVRSARGAVEPVRVQVDPVELG